MSIFTFVEDDSSTVNLEERCICTFDRFLNFLSVGLRFFGEFFPWAAEYRDRRNDWTDATHLITIMHGTVF